MSNPKKQSTERKKQERDIGRIMLDHGMTDVRLDMDEQRYDYDGSTSRYQSAGTYSVQLNVRHISQEDADRLMEIFRKRL